MSFELYGYESPGKLTPDESILDPSDVSAPWFRGMTHELYAAPARFGVNVGRAAGLAAGAINLPIDYALGTDLSDQAFASVSKLTKVRESLILAPDEIGVAAQTIGAVGEFVTGLVAGAGNPALLLATQELNTALELSDKGVRPSVAVGAAGVEAVATALSFQIPMFGQALGSRVALGAAGGAGEGAVTRGSIETILNTFGYAEQAKQFNMWDGQAIAIDLLTGGIFGGVYHAATRNNQAAVLKPDKDDERVLSDTMPPDQVDAVLATNDHAHRVAAGAPGQPLTADALDKHVRAAEDALSAILADEPVTARVEPDLFGPDLRRDDIARERQAAAEAELGPAPPDPKWDNWPANWPRTLPDDSPLLRETSTLPDRRWVADRVLDHFLGAAVPAEGRPVAIILGGGGGSGKGTIKRWLAERGELPARPVDIDPDEIKMEWIPEFKALHEKGDSRGAALVHQESSNIARELFERAVAMRANLILDRTMNNRERSTKEIEALKAAGYEVRLAGVALDTATAMARSEKRAEHSGRYVPIDALREAHTNFSRQFEGYADLVDDARLFDNNDAEPRLIAHREGEGLAIDDPFGYDRFRRKGDENQTESGENLRRDPEGERPGGPEALGADQSGSADPGVPQGALEAQAGPGRDAVPLEISATLGHATSVTTERGQQVPVRWALVELGDLVTSHTDALDVNPAYPAELQPRDRGRAASEAQIARIQGDIRPELLAESQKASDGAPIVGRDGAVESGNARTIALRRAYANDQADGYRQWLTENTERFGIDPAALDGLQRPMLVRAAQGDYDRAEFARQANESAVARMSPSEQARADAARIETLEGLATNEDGSINLAGSQDFLNRFMRDVVSPSEQGEVSTAAGSLSQSGLSRVRNAIFSKAYGDPDLVAMLTESLDANVKNVLAGMMRSAPFVARLRTLIDEGARHDVPVIDDLVRGVREYGDMRRDKLTLADREAQGDMFGGDVLPTGVRNVIVGLEENSRAPVRMAAMIRHLVDTVDNAGDPRQAGLFGDSTRPEAADVSNAAVEAVRRDYDVRASADLFGAGGREAGADRVLAEALEIAATRPELTVTRDDGTEVNAAQALREADDAVRQAAALEPGIAALAGCASSSMGEAA